MQKKETSRPKVWKARKDRAPVDEVAIARYLHVKMKVLLRAVWPPSASSDAGLAPIMHQRVLTSHWICIIRCNWIKSLFCASCSLHYFSFCLKAILPDFLPKVTQLGDNRVGTWKMPPIYQLYSILLLYASTVLSHSIYYMQLLCLKSNSEFLDAKYSLKYR